MLILDKNFYLNFQQGDLQSYLPIFKSKSFIEMEIWGIRLEDLESLAINRSEDVGDITSHVRYVN